MLTNNYKTTFTSAFYFALLSLLVASCFHTNAANHKQQMINAVGVDKIYIDKLSSRNDSVLLTDSQQKLFVTEWNDATSLGMYKMRGEYSVTLVMKNDSIKKFHVYNELIKEKGDWTYALSDSNFIRDLFEQNKYSKQSETQEDYTPITFISHLTSPTPRSGHWFTLVKPFPKDWVKEEHIDSLIYLLNDKSLCGCAVSPLSSYLPDDFAQKGGYAALFIQAYKEGKEVDLGLYACPQVDQNLNAELMQWWKNEFKHSQNKMN